MRLKGVKQVIATHPAPPWGAIFVFKFFDVLFDSVAIRSKRARGLDALSVINRSFDLILKLVYVFQNLPGLKLAVPVA